MNEHARILIVNVTWLVCGIGLAAFIAWIFWEEHKANREMWEQYAREINRPVAPGERPIPTSGRPYGPAPKWIEKHIAKKWPRVNGIPIGHDLGDLPINGRPPSPPAPPPKVKT